MKDSSALKPNFFNNMPTFVNDKEAEIAGASDEERQLYTMSQSAGWKIIQGFIESLMTDLDNAVDSSLSQGLALEEIGKNAVVANISKGIIKRVLQKVGDAKDACEQSNGTDK